MNEPVLALRRIHEREAGHVSGIPAVHGSAANLAGGIAPLLERQVSRRQLIFGPAIGTFKDHHPFTPSDGDSLLSEEHFGLHGAAIRAFKFVN